MIINTVDSTVDTCWLMSALGHNCLLIALMLNTDPTIPLWVAEMSKQTRGIYFKDVHRLLTLLAPTLFL